MGESQNELTRIDTAAKLQSCEIEMSITRMAWSKLMGYCRATDNEVSGFMLLERDGGLLYISDVYIVEQVCTGTSTEMDSTAIAKLQLRLYKEKIIGQEDKPNIKLAHFHTHPTFGVFWSGTDMEMRAKLRAGNEYSVALVINQKGDTLAAIDINGEFPMSISNVPVSILEDAEIFKACKAEVEAKIKSPAQANGYEQYFQGRYDFSGPDRPSHALRKGQAGGFAHGGKRGRPRKNPLDPKWFEELGDGLSPQQRKDNDDSVRLALTDDELLLGRRMAAAQADDGIYSNEHGTWCNVGGEIIQLEGPNGGPIS